MFGVIFSKEVIFGQARNIIKSIGIKNEEDLFSDIKDVRMRPRMIENKKSTFNRALADHRTSRGSSIKSSNYCSFQRLNIGFYLSCNLCKNYG